MNIHDALKELGGQMGLPNLKLDDNKVCRLIFDKKFTVDIEASEDEKMVHIYSAICIIPPDDKERLYEALLEANLFGRGTGGSAFGVDLEMGEILLCTTVTMDKTDYQDFVNTLEGFVNHVEAWTEKIDSREYNRPGHGHGGSSSANAPKKDTSGKDGDDKPPEGPPQGYIMA